MAAAAAAAAASITLSLNPASIIRSFLISTKPISCFVPKRSTTAIFHFPEHSTVSHETLITNNNNINNVIDIIKERGLVESITYEEDLRSAISSNSTPLKVYCGFDPTAQTLHLGNLLGIIVLSWFQKCGHQSVALIGGATGRIGDPSGKSLERPELDLDTLNSHIVGISNTITAILRKNVNSYESFSVLNNYDWWKEIKLLDFLNNVGGSGR